MWLSKRNTHRYTIWFGLTGMFLYVDASDRASGKVRCYNVDTHTTFYITRAECARYIRQAQTTKHTSIVRD